MDKSFVSKSELHGFDQDRKVISDPEAALNFEAACKSRIIRMYKEWFEKLRLNIYVVNDSEVETL